MVIITILFFGLFLHEICAVIQIDDYVDYDVDPTDEWSQKYQKEFDQIGVANFSLSAGHVLHALTVEDAMTSFNIEMPKNNGIPSGNPDLSADDSGAVLANVPSRPSEFSTAGLRGFVDFMDHVTDPNWEGKGSKLLRVLHLYHMQEMWAVARKAADEFSGVSENICIGALDHANNGIEKALTVIFKAFKTQSKMVVLEIPLTWDDNGESWKEYKKVVTFHDKPNQMKSMGLYAQCIMRKFRNNDQPIELESCCSSKTVGDVTYTLVTTGKTLSRCTNGCIYTRTDKLGSQYCFASGTLMVQCLD